MSLNKFCDIGVKKEWMNINCNKIECNELDATTLDIGSLNVDNIITQSLSVINGASIGDLTVLRTLNTDELKVNGITYPDKLSNPRTKTILSVPTDVGVVQQVINPYVAYTDDPYTISVVPAYTVIFPNPMGLSPQSSLTLPLKEGNCYEFVAYLKPNNPTEIITPTVFSFFLDNTIPLTYTIPFALSRLSKDEPIKISCRFSLEAFTLGTYTIFSAIESVSTFAGSPTPFETELQTNYFNAGSFTSPTPSFSFAVSNALTNFPLKLQSASLNCVYSSNVALAV